MINHARNLLMNTADISYNKDILLDEIIDPKYKVKRLTSCISNIRNVIFGHSPDRAMLNFRIFQLLSIIHNSELKEFIFNLDRRVTYNFDKQLPDSSYYVSQLSGSTNDLNIVTQNIDNDNSGKLQWEWNVSYTGGVTTCSLFPGNVSGTTTPSFSAGLSSYIPLIGTGMSIQHRDSNASWYIKHYEFPKKDLGQILAEIQQIDVNEVFNVGNALSKEEPFKTTYSLWKTVDDLPRKLGALTVALIYKTDSL